jgi:hypothetical protein
VRTSSRIRAGPYFLALSWALNAGRAAISVRRKTGDGKRDGSKVDFPVAHCQWGKKRVCGNRGAIPQVSRHAAVHGALGLIVSRRKRSLGFRRSRTMVVMLVHRAITVVCRHGHRMA